MIVKQAAGELGLDRLVLDLHGRWPGRDLPTGAFAAGVAAFHLGRYAQAAKYWQRIAAPDWTAAMDGYAVAADWAEAGVIPPFRLEYHLDNKETALSAADSGDGVITHGGVRVRLLAAVPSTDAIARAMREEVEEKPISLNVSLASTLKQIPVQWLNAAATIHGLAPAKRRPEREKALATALKDRVRLRTALAAESADVRAALQYLLETGGWCKLPALTKRFGSLHPDGFFWDERLPTSAIGRLRLLGLVFVGRAIVDGRRYKVAVIPADLRAVLPSGV